MQRILGLALFIGIAACGISQPRAEEAREEIMAKCQEALRFWPKNYPQLIANYVKADLETAPKVACDRVVAGVLAGRIKSSDFSLCSFLQGSPPELMIVLSGH